MVTNTLAYSDTESTTAVKRFVGIVIFFVGLETPL